MTVSVKDSFKTYVFTAPDRREGISDRNVTAELYGFASEGFVFCFPRIRRNDSGLRGKRGPRAVTRYIK